MRLGEQLLDEKRYLFVVVGQFENKKLALDCSFQLFKMRKY